MTLDELMEKVKAANQYHDLRDLFSTLQLSGQLRLDRSAQYSAGHKLADELFVFDSSSNFLAVKLANQGEKIGLLCNPGLAIRIRERFAEAVNQLVIDTAKGMRDRAAELAESAIWPPVLPDSHSRLLTLRHSIVSVIRSLQV